MIEEGWGLSEFVEFTEEGEEKPESGKWKILVVEDEEDVHRLTRIVLKDLIFDGKGVEIISAYSKKEAMEILKREKDIALAIIDVVMEDKSAGLDLAKYIREELKNFKTRIIIRTGQPGYAPRREVILNYDINDYREKTELSTEMMIGVVITALRSYRDIINYEREGKMMNTLVNILSHPPKEKGINSFILQILKSLADFLRTNSIDLSGVIVDKEGKELRFGPNPPEKKDLPDIKNGKVRWLNSNELFLNFTMGNKKIASALLHFKGDLNERWRELLSIYAFQLINLVGNRALETMFDETMDKMIYTLADLIEHRSVETGEHIRRVSEMTYIIAKAMGFDESYAQSIRLASMLHDVGKIGIPDNILNKPGKLTDEEYEVMKTHTIIGYKILSKHDNEVFKIAAKVALYHHENWDGSGYPEGLMGEEIPIEARIVSVIDSYDALLSDRVYRPAWPESKVAAYIKTMSGIKFDPRSLRCFSTITMRSRR